MLPQEASDLPPILFSIRTLVELKSHSQEQAPFHETPHVLIPF